MGRTLVEFVKRWALERGDNVLLTSGNKPERKRAHRFYEKMGFLHRDSGL
ncbi:hypothetical protein B9D94_09215 [Paenibacillus sp. Cedars]|nr:hypothetical protein B9D94_09215 [Paenibacillus sp. Cedars]